MENNDRQQANPSRQGQGQAGFPFPPYGPPQSYPDPRFQGNQNYPPAPSEGYHNYVPVGGNQHPAFFQQGFGQHPPFPQFSNNPRYPSQNDMQYGNPQHHEEGKAQQEFSKTDETWVPPPMSPKREPIPQQQHQGQGYANQYIQTQPSGTYFQGNQQHQYISRDMATYQGQNPGHQGITANNQSNLSGNIDRTCYPEIPSFQVQGQGQKDERSEKPSNSSNIPQTVPSAPAAPAVKPRSGSQDNRPPITPRKRPGNPSTEQGYNVGSGQPLGHGMQQTNVVPSEHADQLYRAQSEPGLRSQDNYSDPQQAPPPRPHRTESVPYVYQQNRAVGPDNSQHPPQSEPYIQNKNIPSGQEHIPPQHNIGPNPYQPQGAGVQWTSGPGFEGEPQPPPYNSTNPQQHHVTGAPSSQPSSNRQVPQHLLQAPYTQAQFGQNPQAYEHFPAPNTGYFDGQGFPPNAQMYGQQGAPYPKAPYYGQFHPGGTVGMTPGQQPWGAQPPVDTRTSNQPPQATSVKPDVPKRTVKKTKAKKRVSDSESDEEEEAGTSTIMVTLRKVVTEDTLVLYFENKKKSGGGEIEEVEFSPEEKIAVIEFKDPQAAERVVKKPKHTIDKGEVKVTVIVSFSEAFEEDAVLIKGIGPKATEENLTDYIEARVNCDVTGIVFGAGNEMAVVTFEENIDVKELQQSCNKRKMANRSLKLSRVFKSRSIQVRGYKNISIESLTLYFENKKSGGGDVEEVEELTGVCIIHFLESKVARNVCSRTGHKTDNKRLEVSMYYPCLGPPVPEVVDIPGSLTIEIDQHILTFTSNSKKYKDELEKQLAKKHAKPNWETSKKTGIVVDCTLRLDDNPSHETVESWEGVVKQLVKSFVDDLVNMPVQFDNTAVKNQVMKQASDLNVENPEDVSLIPTTDMLMLVGRKADVVVLKSQIEAITESVEQKAKEAKESVQDSTKVKQLYITPLKDLGIVSELKSKFPNLTLSFEQKGTVHFNGRKPDVDAAKVFILEEITDFVDKNLQLKEGIQHLLVKPEIIDQLQQNLRSQDVLVSICCQPGEDSCSIVAKTHDETKKAAQEIKSHLRDEDIHIQDHLQQFWISADWKKTKAKLEEEFDWKFCVMKNDDKECIIVSATSDVFDKVAQSVHGKVDSFLKKRSVESQLIEVDPNVLLYLDRYYKKEVQKALDDHHNVKVIKMKTGFELWGSKEDYTPLMRTLKSFISRVKSDKCEIQYLGFRNFFHSAEGQNGIKNVEQNAKCILQVKEDKGQVVRSKGRRSGGNPLKVYAECIDENGVKFKVMEGDMTKLRADVVVNAANSNLKHTGGMAKAIVNAGGDVITKACQKHVNSKGDVRPGEAVSTPSGKLPCKLLIHAVAKSWKDGEHGELDALEKAVKKSLDLMSEHDLHDSIAFPALGANLFKYPLDLVTKVIVKTLRAQLEKRVYEVSSLKTIYFCDMNHKAVQSFTKALIHQYGFEKVEISGRAGSPGPTTRTKSYTSDSDSDDDCKADSDEEPKTRQTRKSPRNSWGKRDSESDEETDTQGESGSTRNLRGKRKSKSDEETESEEESEPKGATGGTKPRRGWGRKKEAGDAGGQGHPKGQGQSGGHGTEMKVVKEELNKMKVDVIINSINSDLDMTVGALSKSLLNRGGNIIQRECKSKYPNGIKTGEIAVTRGGNLDCTWIYHSTIPKYDGKANGASIKTLGNLVTDCLKLAEKYHMSTIAFPAMGTGQLGYPADQVAMTMFQMAKTYIQGTPGSSIQKILFVVFPKDAATVRAFQDVEKKVGGITVSTAAPQSGPKTDTWCYVKVTVDSGDITTAMTDVVVNSTNDSMDLSKGATSKAILHAAGSMLQHECNSKVQHMRSKGLVYTGPGNMSCQAIFHIKSQKNTNGWEKLVKECLEEADRQSYKSISFPALGTGGFNVQPKEVAEAMLKAIHKFCNSKPKNIQEVRIIVFQLPMMNEFQEAMDKVAQGTGFVSIVKGLFSSGKSKNTNDAAAEDDEKKSKQQTHMKKTKPLKSSVVVMIWYDAHSDLKRAKERLHALVKDNFETIVIAEKKEILKELVPRKKHLEQAVRRSVSVDLDVTAGKITLQGPSREVLESHPLVLEFVHNFYKEKAKYEKFDNVANYVQWYYDKDGEWVKFLREPNYTIEMAYKDKKSSVEVYDRRKKKYFVDLKNMEESEFGNTAKTWKIKRRDKSQRSSGISLPQTWDSMKHDEPLKVVPLQAGNKEYENVKTKFLNSSGGSYTISKIERIQHKFMYQQYAAKRAELQTKNKKDPQQWLWHGTDKDTMSKINQNGFNRSYCGKHGTAIGNGVYFAVNANYSVRGFCPVDGSGCKHIYSCQVLTGEPCQGQGGMNVLPPKGTGVETYDSATDSVSNPGMFVIFHDSQAYPAYHITFK